MNLKKLIFLFFFGWIGLVFFVNAQPGEPISDLKTFCSQQKGFNLLGKFDVSWSNTGFFQKDFYVIHDLGFNFVRLPLDYRTYTQTGNWDVFTEAQLVKIDQAVKWGEQYNVHICINQHRAPGFCVNPADNLPANQKLNLWTDSVAQKAFVNHWKMFANRYKNIPPDRLSFNLVNEPFDITEEVYVSIMKKAIDAIHAITPNRVIFVDGLGYGRGLLLSLKNEPNVAQSIHTYDPFQLTHYKANWVSGSSDWPVPQWPMLWISNYLYGPSKSEFKSPLVIQGNFQQGTEITVNVGQVSIESTFQIKSGSKVVLSKKFVCGASLGTDFTKIVSSQWGYQNISNKDYAVTLAASATSLSFENVSGDWMTINSVTIKKGDVVKTYNLSDNTWGKKQGTYKMAENGELTTPDGNDLLPFGDYRTVIEMSKQYNIPFMVQEFGVHNQTPHKVTVDFLADLTAFFRQNNLGFALWNLTGSFGILNSDRTDCTYESYQGYKLDREMLNAITKSGVTSAATLKKQAGFRLFPVPAKSELFFSAESFSGTTKIEIRDITGRTLKTFTTETAGNENTRLDTSGLKPGMYLLSATNKGKQITGKFLVE
jgi:aryl-phospho-beta-D-glucosidase BglC (GH1 family)